MKKYLKIFFQSVEVLDHIENKYNIISKLISIEIP